MQTESFDPRSERRPPRDGKSSLRLPTLPGGAAIAEDGAGRAGVAEAASDGAPGAYPPDSWTLPYWRWFEETTHRHALQAGTPEAAFKVVSARARSVIRAFSTSFFIVTRFLPPAKRKRVEVIYATVRYPDEVVDTFPLPAAEKLALLDDWRAGYELSQGCGSLLECLEAGVPSFLAGFRQVQLDTGIPAEHYRAFLAAMAHDAEPGTFDTLDDLIDDYVYGSAVVVGYFLAHVYGAAPGVEFERTLATAKKLGVALQLTNFLRDVAEDHRRGRLYLPLEMLRQEGIERLVPGDPSQYPALQRVVRRMADEAADLYDQARADLDTFATDSRTAIAACIEVYGQLNARVGRVPERVLERESVPMRDKFRVLPASKYWRLPLAYMGLQELVA